MSKLKFMYTSIYRIQVINKTRAHERNKTGYKKSLLYSRGFEKRGDSFKCQIFICIFFFLLFYSHININTSGVWCRIQIIKWIRGRTFIIYIIHITYYTYIFSGVIRGNGWGWAYPSPVGRTLKYLYHNRFYCLQYIILYSLCSLFSCSVVPVSSRFIF